MATVSKISASPVRIAPRKRVAAYARVSVDTEALLHSPVSYLAFGQCRLLGQTAHDEPLIKVAATAVAACVIYYFIGYLTLKKKFQLEPSKML